jgi:diacylglycerol kinase family enzyme
VITLVANPASRAGEGKRLWDAWLRTLHERKAPHTLRETFSRSDCETAAALACQDSDMVVAVGGKGTINAVITGMLRAGLGKRTPPLGVLYAGASPDFCRFHGIPTDGAQAMDTLLEGKSRRVDAVAVACGGPAGEAVEGHFACGCHIGLGSATAGFANVWRKSLGEDRFGTRIGLMQAMIRRGTFACRTVTDGETTDFERANHVMILKNPHITSGLRVALPLTPDDGGLALIVVHGYSRFGLLRLLPLLYSGALTEKNGVSVRRCTSILVEADPHQPVEFDGDPQGAGTVSARILPGALSLICRRGD